MPEWLRTTLGPETPDASPVRILWHLSMAFLVGLAVSLIYRWIQRDRVINATFPPTLVLLAILIAGVTQVIGNNVARAFSLVGALSIVRFRTVVQDTQDTAFVIFAVLVGMAVGADHVWVAVLSLIVVGGAAAVIQPRRAAQSEPIAEYRLTVRLHLGLDPDVHLADLFSALIERSRSVSVSTVRQGAGMEHVYVIRLKEKVTPTQLADRLNHVEGVQGVEVRLEKSEVAS
jgi:hypothetical protein